MYEIEDINGTKWSTLSNFSDVLEHKIALLIPALAIPVCIPCEPLGESASIFPN